MIVIRADDGSFVDTVVNEVAIADSPGPPRLVRTMPLYGAVVADILMKGTTTLRPDRLL
jgi:hypothetical protein